MLLFADTTQAFISYMRAVHIQKDKTIFDVAALPAEEYAASMGLPGAPQIKLSEPKTGKARVRAGQKKEEPIEQHEDEVAVVASSDESGDEDEDDVDTEAEAETGGAASVNEQDSEGESDEESGGESDEESNDDDQDEEESESDISEEERPIKAPEVRTKYDRMFERKNQSILTPHYTSLVAHNDGDEEGEEDDVFTLARRDHALSGDEDEDAAEKGGVNATANSKSDSKSVAAAKPLVSSEDLSKRKLKAGTSKKARVKTGPAPEKLVFDEQGNPTNFYEEGTAAESGAAGQRAEYVEMERERMRAADKVDREVAREKKREKKRKRKEREREVSSVGSVGVSSSLPSQ
jgi:ATP-dependent RNA helicase DDX10/DBP4